MIRAHKVRLHPIPEQANALARAAGGYCQLGNVAEQCVRIAL
ncbi:helix-turn-helix domain-containing protein [Ktedonobacter sp. SOSP1-52]|nr:helix-turn-helix domain-containing protein [Ktedonobacter sp. SOSP1-52]